MLAKDTFTQKILSPLRHSVSRAINCTSVNQVHLWACQFSSAYFDCERTLRKLAVSESEDN